MKYLQIQILLKAIEVTMRLAFTAAIVITQDTSPNDMDLWAAPGPSSWPLVSYP